MIVIIFHFRFYHFGYDKTDNVDEIGQPVEDETADNFLDCDHNDFDFGEDVFSERNFNEPEPVPVQTIEEIEVKEVQQQEEGTDCYIEKESLPKIVPTESEVCEAEPTVNLTRSDSALNIFDQTTILKLFSATNWTETFFNRVFRKKFTVISTAFDRNESLLAFKNGLSNEQLIEHISKTHSRLILPAIASSKRDNELTNGLFAFYLPQNTPLHVFGCLSMNSCSFAVVALQ